MCAASEYNKFGKSANDSFLAKTLGIYVIPITVVLLYYAYTATVGHGLLQIDIAIFVVAVLVGRLVSHELPMASALPKRSNRFAPVALAVLAVLFVVFTFCPPQFSLSRDSITAGYGIVG